MRLYKGDGFIAIKSTESEGFVSLWDDGGVCVVEEHVIENELDECVTTPINPLLLYNLLVTLFYFGDSSET